MHVAKLISAMAVVLAFGVFGVTSASAAETLWHILPGLLGEKFKGKTGKIYFLIKGGARTECEKSEVLKGEGEITGELTLGLATMHLTGCKIAITAFESLGDEPKTILMHVQIHTCMIAPNHYGFLITVLQLHLETLIAPIKLFTLEGSFVILVEPANTATLEFKLSITQAGGVQTIEKCEGGSAETLKTSEKGLPAIQTGVEAGEASITFEKEKQTVMA